MIWSYLVHRVPNSLSFATLRSSVFAPRYLGWLAQRVLTWPEPLLGPRVDDAARPLAPSKMVAQARRLAEFTTDRALFTHEGKWITARQQHAVTVVAQIGSWRGRIAGERLGIFVGWRQEDQV